ncbi:late cornified envelope protein 6A [Lepus europaeus]|uniref:late cornified envelope protein 6A n=1 Tax=Lepus europaeus TaxID=9983 RepID=UPI002B463DB2|nr:late cornified envelope protein 6A [Lepus europaeus]
MSQQKQQQSWEPPSAPKGSSPQCPRPCLAPSSAPCSTSCHSGSQTSHAQSPAPSRRRRRRQPRCLSGGTVYPCKEEEC